MHQLRNIYVISIDIVGGGILCIDGDTVRNNFQRTLWSIEILQEHWALMSQRCTVDV